MPFSNTVLGSTACNSSSIDVIDMRPPWELTLDVSLPFGVTNHEQIHIVSINEHSNRVTCN
jgi:hypothetical protein